LELVDIKKMTIRGEETEVSVYEGTDESGVGLRQMIAAFPGKDGTAMLMIMGNIRTWDDELVEDFINSLQ
jgi:hypothetical protein